MIALFESRLKVVFIIFLLIFVLISFRLVYISIKMEDSSYPFQNIISSIQRGQIIDRDGKLLAGNFLVYTVFVDPYVIKDIENVSKQLSKYSMYDENRLKEKLTELKNKRYLVIAEKIDKETLDKILSLKINGVYYRIDILREYPLDDIISPLIGFVDKYNRGLEGLEFYYENFLNKGEDYALRLSIDSFMQFILYNELAKKGQEESSDWAIGIISDSKNGEILALANWPSFSPSIYGSYDVEKRKNRAILNSFEPGSTFKVFIASALLNEEKVSLNEYFYCDGEYKVTENIKIKDTYNKNGSLNLTDIIKYSSNVGIIKSSMKIDSSILYQYLRNFNFGSKTGLDYPAEAEGILKPIKNWTKMTRAIINIGQEISVSSVQLIAAFNSLLNGGYFYEPHLVIGKNFKNSEYEKYKAKIVRRVIEQQTSNTIRNILIEALKGSTATGRLAYTDHAIVGGKTGTAQVPYTNGRGYDPDKTFASFLGFFELSDNIYTLFIGFMNPKKNSSGGVVAAEVFKNIVESISPYLKIKNKKPIAVDVEEYNTKDYDRIFERALQRIIKEDVIPDFTGLTLKEAIFLASKLGIKIKVSGSGFVFYQSILPGSAIENDMSITLKLNYR